VVIALLTGVFIALLEVLGGLLSMLAFMAASLWLLNPRRHLQNALVAILLPVATYVVFVVWLRASMPRGVLPLPF
jgi:zinc transporter ZupT